MAFNDSDDVIGWHELHPLVVRGGVHQLGTAEGAPRIILENGTIAGIGHLPHGVDLRVWDAAGDHITPLPSYIEIDITAMNAAGDIVMTDRFGEGWDPDSILNVTLLYRNGVLQQLPSIHPHFVSTVAEAMNARGQIVGSSAAKVRVLPPDIPAEGDNTLVYHPFLWQDGVMRDLGVFGKSQDPCDHAAPCAVGGALDINSQGDVVGFSQDSALVRRPFLWRNGQMTDLGVFAGGGATARFINDRRQIAGDNDTLAFLWDTGTATVLGSLGGNGLRVTAVNERGDVAGTGFASDGRQHAFVWRNGRMIDLGIPIIGGCAATAVDINENGEVLIAVAMSFCAPQSDTPLTKMYATNQRAVIWHPPTP